MLLGHHPFLDHCVSRFRFYFRCAYINPPLVFIQVQQVPFPPFLPFYTFFEPGAPDFLSNVQSLPNSVNLQVHNGPLQLPLRSLCVDRTLFSTTSSKAHRSDHRRCHTGLGTSMREFFLSRAVGSSESVPFSSPRVVRVNATPFPKQPLQVSWLPEETVTSKTQPIR